ncbi:carboxylate-amine ligase [Arthrobacter sp. AG1021]|uniref:carboxylate-amine ligase n=1 Tax=Arthrobacter sp. AG1021 TaxID=2183908 RepID=UPI0006B2429F|nr:YbdK family carboxylate-amine ligase [Arthrobacter sp. AG1021]RKS22039.1 carboxylate-amine ligase [Arthrobacter sp. AG1021]
MPRTFGIEEEFFLVNPQTATLATVPPGLLGDLQGENLAGATLVPELLRPQVELVSGICTRASDALESLLLGRQKLQEACAGAGLAAVATGTPPFLPGATEVSEGQRYEDIRQFVPGIVREHYINGLHIHVHIPDAPTGLQAMNVLRPWLPALTAIGANSPVWNGELSGFESWRMVHYRRWSVIGVPPAFDSMEHYQRMRRIMLDSGALLDAGHIGWAVRLSERNPTIEVRTADGQLTADESVAIAMLVRALVDTGLAQGGVAKTVEDRLLDLGLWHASKMGLSGPLFDAGTETRLEPEQVLGQLLDYAGEHLADNGDLDFVQNYFARITSVGNGAQRQRASWARGGGTALVHDAQQEFARETISELRSNP